MKTNNQESPIFRYSGFIIVALLVVVAWSKLELIYTAIKIFIK